MALQKKIKELEEENQTLKMMQTANIQRGTKKRSSLKMKSGVKKVMAVLAMKDSATKEESEDGLSNHPQSQEKKLRASESVIEEESKESTIQSNFEADTILERESEGDLLDPVEEEEDMYEEEDNQLMEKQRREIVGLKKEIRKKEANMRELMGICRARDGQIQ